MQKLKNGKTVKYSLFINWSYNFYLLTSQLVSYFKIILCYVLIYIYNRLLRISLPLDLIFLLLISYDPLNISPIFYEYHIPFFNLL